MDPQGSDLLKDIEGWGAKLKEHCEKCGERTRDCETRLCEEKEREFDELFSERLDRDWVKLAERTGMLDELKKVLRELG